MRVLPDAPLVVRSPQNVQVTGCLFLGSSTLVLATAKKWPCPECPVIKTIDDMIITSNRWNTNNRANTSIVRPTCRPCQCLRADRPC